MDYPAIIAFFDEYNEHFREFMQFEYKKLDLIHKGEIEKLSSSLSAEQAFIMKSNMLEKRRVALTGENITFAELIENAPESCKAVLTEKYKVLSETVLKIKDINDNANMIVTERLKKIRAHVGENDTYDGRGGVKKEILSHSTMSTNA